MLTAKELLNKINEETILQISMPDVAIRIINEAKSEWCKEQRAICANRFERFHEPFITDVAKVVYNSILNAPEPC
jgi:hypothetical protein